MQGRNENRFLEIIARQLTSVGVFYVVSDKLRVRFLKRELTHGSCELRSHQANNRSAFRGNRPRTVSLTTLPLFFLRSFFSGEIRNSPLKISRCKKSFTRGAPRESYYSNAKTHTGTRKDDLLKTSETRDVNRFEEW